MRELFEEFETILTVEPNLERLETVFNLVETRYRHIKKQQEALADGIVEDSGPEADEMLWSNSDAGRKLKNDHLELVKTFAAHRKKLNSLQKRLLIIQNRWKP